MIYTIPFLLDSTSAAATGAETDTNKNAGVGAVFEYEYKYGHSFDEGGGYSDCSKGAGGGPLDLGETSLVKVLTSYGEYDCVYGHYNCLCIASVVLLSLSLLHLQVYIKLQWEPLARRSEDVIHSFTFTKMSNG